MKPATEAKTLSDIQSSKTKPIDYYIQMIPQLIDCSISDGKYETCLRVDKDVVENVENYLHKLGYSTYYSYGILDIRWDDRSTKTPTKKLSIFKTLFR